MIYPHLQTEDNLWIFFLFVDGVRLAETLIDKLISNNEGIRLMLRGREKAAEDKVEAQFRTPVFYFLNNFN